MSDLSDYFQQAEISVVDGMLLFSPLSDITLTNAETFKYVSLYNTSRQYIESR
jgi:hypothetical protein